MPKGAQGVGGAGISVIDFPVGKMKFVKAAKPPFPPLPLPSITPEDVHRAFHGGKGDAEIASDRKPDSLIGRKIYFLAHRGDGQGAGVPGIVAGFYSSYNAAAHAKAKLERMGGGAGGRSDMFEIVWRRVVA